MNVYFKYPSGYLAKMFVTGLGIYDALEAVNEFEIEEVTGVAPDGAILAVIDGLKS